MKAASIILFLTLFCIQQMYAQTDYTILNELSSHIEAVNLKCEYLTDPMGIDMPDPRFFWKLSSDEDGQMQSAYQLLVSTSRDMLDRNKGNMFDSGKRRSQRNTHIVYDGKPLESATSCFWKVRVWDKAGKVSKWSAPASFMTGLFSAEDWKGAEWIAWRPQDEWAGEWWRKKEIEKQCYEFHLPGYFGARMNMWERYHFWNEKPHDPAPLYRKEFKVEKKVVKGYGFYQWYRILRTLY